MSQETKPTERLTTRCCIAGGGPAGMMLGLLLARAGVDVVVLEKHEDFLRDFRGDTIHPSTLELMYELGFLEAFLKRPHQEVHHLAGQIGATRVSIADFTHLPTHCKFLALMPQWEFLDFISEQARRYPTFRLLMRTSAVDLLDEGGRVAGVRAETTQGPLEIRADLVVAADGRSSTLRARARLSVEDLGSPIDVLWMRLSRRPSDGDTPLGHMEAGRMLVTINRGDYWQCAYIIPKGGFDEIRRAGLPAFREAIATLSPELGDRTGELGDWNDIKLLTVQVDRLTRWYRPGLLCIGDAAHAMSPIGGVGINLAVQDAVAAANLLAEPLRQGRVTEAHLRALQHRRELPTRLTQALQLLIQDRVLGRLLTRSTRPEAPLPILLLDRWSWLQRLPAFLVGVGVRPEHVRTPARQAQTQPSR